MPLKLFRLVLSHAITIKKDDDYNIEDDIKYDKERGVVYHPKKVGEQLCLKTNFLHSVIMISMIL